MEQLRFREILPYSAKDLHDLVMDAARYREFSHYIKRVDVSDLGRGKKHVEVLIGTPRLPVAIRYGCELESLPPHTIKAIATKSPFKEMRGELTFRTLPNGHTEVSCLLEYETGWNPIAMAAAKVMKVSIEEGIAAAKDYLATRLTPVGTPAAPKPSI